MTDYDTARVGDPVTPRHHSRPCSQDVDAYGCTRPRGHQGQHVAEGLSTVLAVAPQDVTA